MTSEEKQILLDKIQDLLNLAKSIPVREEADLFNQVVENPVIQPTQFTPSACSEAEKVTRRRFTDGTMTASMLASRLSKEFGRPISREQVVKVARSCNAESHYNERQHNARFTPESVTMIITLFKSIL